jgi:gliding motility associated protien GldN
MGPDPAVSGKVDSFGKPLDFADELIDLFWIFYPDAREILANNTVYNKANTSADLSYDDLLNARRFSSIIYKSSTGMGEGKVADYIPRNSDEQLEESNRIKGKILEMENEMWNY